MRAVRVRFRRGALIPRKARGRLLAQFAVFLQEAQVIEGAGDQRLKAAPVEL